MYSLHPNYSLKRPISVTVKDGDNNGYKVTYEYHPKQRQERVLVQKPSLTPLIRQFHQKDSILINICLLQEENIVNLI